MSQDIKELRVGPSETSKRIMYLTKEFLLNNETIDVVAGTASAPNVARSCEALVRLNYVSYVDLRTETQVVNERRRTRLVVRLQKTSQFAKLYEENEVKRKVQEAEREEQKKQTANN